MLKFEEDIGILSAPEKTRLEFIELQIVWARKLIADGAHTPHIRLLLRQAIYYQWERPSSRNYSASQAWSAQALKYKGRTIKERRKDLRFDHAIPLNIIANKLTNDGQMSVEDVLSRMVRGSVITHEEDLALTQAGLQSKMPDGWNWKTGDINARYNIVGIKI